MAVLKLLGSLNWVGIPSGLRRKEPLSVRHLTEQVVCTHDLTYYDVWDSLDEPPLIVPPILSKRVPTNTFLKRIWQVAFNSIVDAEKVAIIGYSIPNDGLQARCLLRMAWAARAKRMLADSMAPDQFLLIDPKGVLTYNFLKSSKLRL